MGDPGILYIVATPIGNLDDISQRALKILQEADIVAAEDTRHSKKLLQAYQISTPMVSLHEHNEASRAQELVNRLAKGQRIALISDAGTPLISDPGYVLVSEVRAQGYQVVPIPGACAAVAALCAAGLPTDRFLFVGFLPQKNSPRRQALENVLQEPCTLVLYESPRRIIELLQLINELDAQRTVCLAKELTKTFERFFTGCAADLLRQLEDDPDLQKGEWVVLLAGCDKPEELVIPPAVLDAVELAARDLPLKKACELVARLTDRKKNALYQAVLERRGE